MSISSDTTKLVRGLTGIAPRDREHAAGSQAASAGPTVTVSREVGAGGAELARMLAAHLGVHCFDKELLDAIVRVAHVDRYLMERLDEHVSGVMDEVVCSLIEGSHGVGKEDYRRHLVRVLDEIHSHGGVIVGRGANLVLAGRKVFRVRLTGTPLICARRIAVARGLSEELALRLVLRVNQERAFFIYKLFGRDINDASDYDLVVNTDHIGLPEAQEIAFSAMRRSGFAVEERAATEH